MGSAATRDTVDQLSTQHDIKTHSTRTYHTYTTNKLSKKTATRCTGRVSITQYLRNTSALPFIDSSGKLSDRVGGLVAKIKHFSDNFVIRHFNMITNKSHANL